MAYGIKGRLESLIDHYVVLCFVFVLVILSLIGVGDVRTAGLVGILLCGAGMTQDTARVDLWILIPFIVYDLAAMASSYAFYGNIVDGYGAMHAVFPVVYLLMSCLDEKEMRLLKRCCVLLAGAIAAAGIGRFIFQAVGQGRVGLYVEEANQSWASSSPENDSQAVTIEVANDEVGGDWHVSDSAYERLLDLCEDICRRNGIRELRYTGDETGNLTLHSMFYSETECPGPYLKSRMDEIASEVNRRLNGD